MGKTMKRSLIALTMIAVVNAQTALYLQDFSTDPTIADAPADGTNATVTYSTTTGWVAGEYFRNTGVAVPNPTTDGGTLDFTGMSHAKDMKRGSVAGVFVDTSGWATGDVTISFDVASFSMLGVTAGGSANFAIYSGSGAVDADTTSTTFLRSDGSLTFTPLGSASTPTLRGSSAISADGVVSFDLDLGDDYGDAGDYVALYWTSVRVGGGGVKGEGPLAGNYGFPGFTVDNIGIEPIPEPATLGILGLGMIATLLRRRP